MNAYQQFIQDKSQIGKNSGFKPSFIPDFLFDFQKHLCEWSILKGRAAMFADCGLGKTPMQLVWAQNVVEETNRPVLILTPLAVAGQTVREGEKFGIETYHSRDGKFPVTAKVIVTNYERLHYFDWKQFGGVACDESSILKNFDGQTKEAVTEFMRRIKYRMLYTATAAPNDYIELGTSSEALGELGYMDMLNRFFKTMDNSGASHGGTGGRFASYLGGKYRFRGHAEHDFWRWVCSWARAVRKPSDLGFDDGQFILPELTTEQFCVEARTKKEGCLFDMPAQGLSEQREERRRTIQERCEKAAEITNGRKGFSVAFCNLNDESELLTELIKGAIEVTGSQSDDEKEEAIEAFQKGQATKLVSKATIIGFGLNLQFCSHATYFPSHSFEQWYQAIRRFWRFGQKETVKIDVVTSEGESSILKNLQRKASQAEVMFGRLVSLMNNELRISQSEQFNTQIKKPTWL